MAFKRQVVAELEGGRLRSQEEARARYGIAGSQTIRRWIRRLGKDHLLPKVVRVEKPEEADAVVQLRKQVRDLQQALGQTQLQNVLHETLLVLACEQLGVSVEAFKKKADAKRLPGPGKATGGG
jgi:transposase-like protein